MMAVWVVWATRESSEPTSDLTEIPICKLRTLSLQPQPRYFKRYNKHNAKFVCVVNNKICIKRHVLPLSTRFNRINCGPLPTNFNSKTVTAFRIT